RRSVLPRASIPRPRSQNLAADSASRAARTRRDLSLRGSQVVQPAPLISVVVPAFQAEETIERCVVALSAQTVPRKQYELIVVDRGSSDDPATRAETAGARVVRLAHNMGPSAARNVGVAVARGELVVFTDADCEPTRDFLAALTEYPLDP